MKNTLKISHGVERQELFGCYWTLKAEKSSEKVSFHAEHAVAILPMCDLASMEIN